MNRTSRVDLLTELRAVQRLRPRVLNSAWIPVACILITLGGRLGTHHGKATEPLPVVTPGDARTFRERGSTVEGEARYTNFLSEDSRYFKFRFTQVGPRWRLQVGQPGFHEFGYMDTGYDGTNLFTLSYNNSDLPTELARKATNLAYFVTGMVTNTQFPPVDGANSRIFWEILASHDSDVLTQLGGCGFALGKSAPCPKTLSFALDPRTGLLSSAIVCSSSNVMQNGTVSPYQAPFAATGVVQVVVNAAPLSLVSTPAATRSFTWDYYLPSFDARSAYRQTLAWSFRGCVTNVTPAPAEFNPRPALHDTVLVIDYQSSELPGLEYLARTNWLAPESPEYQRLIEMAKRAKSERTLRYVRPVLLALAFVMITVLLFWRARSGAPAGAG